MLDSGQDCLPRDLRFFARCREGEFRSDDVAGREVVVVVVGQTAVDLGEVSGDQELFGGGDYYQPGFFLFLFLFLLVIGYYYIIYIVRGSRRLVFLSSILIFIY